MKADPEPLGSRPIKRVLIICREHVGDIVNSTPYIRALQQKFSGARFTVDVGQNAAGVLENFPDIAELWRRPTHEGSLGKLAYVSRIRKGRFDLAVILDDSNRFVMETWLAGVPLRYGIFRSRHQGLFTGYSTWSRERHDLFDPFDELMREMNVVVGTSRPVMYPDQEDVHYIRQLLEKSDAMGARLVALNPSSGREYNRWRGERWVEIADWLADQGYRTVLFGPRDQADANKVIAESCMQRPLDWTGLLSLVQVFEALRRSKYLISVDTGTVHIAAASGTPSVILYGPTDPKRFYPHGDRWEAIRSEDQKMANIPTEMVRNAFESLQKRFSS